MRSVTFALVLAVTGLFSASGRPSGAPAAVLATTHRLEANGICSGTAIGPGHHALLTASHCGFTPESGVKVDGKDVKILAVIADGHDHDILVVDMTFDQVAQLAGQPDDPGTDIWIRGNAAGLNQMVRRGTFQGAQQTKNGPINLYDYNGFFGDSGSGVFDSQGRVLDVISTGDQFNEVESMVVDHGQIQIDMLSFKFGAGFGLHFTPEQLAQAAA